jgi:hypothetical protein
VTTTTNKEKEVRTHKLSRKRKVKMALKRRGLKGRAFGEARAKIVREVQKIHRYERENE